MQARIAAGSHVGTLGRDEPGEGVLLTEVLVEREAPQDEAEDVDVRHGVVVRHLVLPARRTREDVHRGARSGAPRSPTTREVFDGSRRRRHRRSRLAAEARDDPSGTDGSSLALDLGQRAAGGTRSRRVGDFGLCEEEAGRGADRNSSTPARGPTSPWSCRSATCRKSGIAAARTSSVLRLLLLHAEKGPKGDRVAHRRRRRGRRHGRGFHLRLRRYVLGLGAREERQGICFRKSSSARLVNFSSSRAIFSNGFGDSEHASVGVAEARAPVPPPRGLHPRARSREERRRGTPGSIGSSNGASRRMISARRGRIRDIREEGTRVRQRRRRTGTSAARGGSVIRSERGSMTARRVLFEEIERVRWRPRALDHRARWRHARPLRRARATARSHVRERTSRDASTPRRRRSPLQRSPRLDAGTRRGPLR